VISGEYSPSITQKQKKEKIVVMLYKALGLGFSLQVYTIPDQDGFLVRYSRFEMAL
jgi:hypothetical protein